MSEQVNVVAAKVATVAKFFKPDALDAVVFMTAAVSAEQFLGEELGTTDDVKYHFSTQIDMQEAKQIWDQASEQFEGVSMHSTRQDGDIAKTFWRKARFHQLSDGKRVVVEYLFIDHGCGYDAENKVVGHGFKSIQAHHTVPIEEMIAFLSMLRAESSANAAQASEPPAVAAAASQTSQ